MTPAAFDYQDPADARGWDDEDTRVDECVHGEHPIECASCTSAGFHAAVSGEGEDMQDMDKMMVERDDSEKRMIEDIGAWIAGASVNALRHAYFAIEREVERRRDEVAQEAKQLASFSKPPRATRKDAGMPRAEYKATKGAA